MSDTSTLAAQATENAPSQHHSMWYDGETENQILVSVARIWERTRVTLNFEVPSKYLRAISGNWRGGSLSTAGIGFGDGFLSLWLSKIREYWRAVVLFFLVLGGAIVMLTILVPIQIQTSRPYPTAAGVRID
ncbi:hypothetical protein DFH09DRAFT_1287454 [Mycena vulgaris]|nr:hypothetical protein DFH09DRAFT_1287454 [Mycena vulgaris]